jgi:hypothetical protein
MREYVCRALFNYTRETCSYLQCHVQLLFPVLFFLFDVLLDDVDGGAILYR